MQRPGWWRFRSSRTGNSYLGFLTVTDERNLHESATAMNSATATLKQAPCAGLAEREADERRIHEKVEAFGDWATTQSPPPTSQRRTCESTYRCEVPSIGGFVQQLAVSYLAHGYFFYVWGIVPEGKDP